MRFAVGLDHTAVHLHAGVVEEQVKTAIASLGTFAWRWDRNVDTLAGFELGDENLYKALGLLNTYVIDSTEAAKEPMKTQDWDGLRSALGPVKEKLDQRYVTGFWGKKS